MWPGVESLESLKTTQGHGLLRELFSELSQVRNYHLHFDLVISTRGVFIQVAVLRGSVSLCVHGGVSHPKGESCGS